jgi:hypothetical protein
MTRPGIRLLTVMSTNMIDSRCGPPPRVLFILFLQLNRLPFSTAWTQPSKKDGEENKDSDSPRNRTGSLQPSLVIFTERRCGPPLRVSFPLELTARYVGLKSASPNTEKKRKRRPRAPRLVPDSNWVSILQLDISPASILKTTKCTPCRTEIFVAIWIEPV